VVGVEHLIGVAEIAEMLGITRQGVDRLTRTRSDFPAPAAVPTAGRIWEREAVEQRARETGRIK
jgi:predicted DNA-binding transcriptional regulator AlpA